MKIINIKLGRATNYNTTTAGTKGSDWSATIEIEKGDDMYPEAREVPADIAAAMAQAAYDALLGSSFFSPTFAPEKVEKPKAREVVPLDEPAAQLANPTTDII